MQIKPVSAPEFAVYGKVLEGYDFSSLLEKLASTTDKPADHTVYVPKDNVLQALPLAQQVQNNLYGGMPVQIGYCNGSNRLLNCLEYHRGSEINVTNDDIVLLLAPLQKVENGQLDTGLVEAFAVPAGTAVLLYETTLHYAPCNGAGKSGFRVAVILPEGTNTEKPPIQQLHGEDKLLWARNKWLIAHPDSDEATQGAYVGLVGKNIVV